jgi:hypothetical protein
MDFAYFCSCISNPSLVSLFMSPTTYVRITTLLTMIFLASCVTHVESPDWRHSYRNCSVSGQAYFRGIPLASGNEHAQAELFEPVDPSNCMIYIVRSDRPGSKSAHAKVFLYHPGTEPPALPSDYWPWFGLNSLLHPRWSERHMQETSRELRKAEIYSQVKPIYSDIGEPDVYAAWELAPGSYVLDASLSIVQPFARAVITCTAGRATFWAVTAKGITALARLNELDETEGKAHVRHRLRSAGMQSGGPRSEGWVGQRECPAE